MSSRQNGESTKIRDPLDLLEFARHLAQQKRAVSPEITGTDSQVQGVGEKGDKGEKDPPSGHPAPRPSPAGLIHPLDDSEIAWRVEGMRPQVPSHGVIPWLVAREFPWKRGQCLSCGDPLPEDRKCRCIPCTKAAWIAVKGVEADV